MKLHFCLLFALFCQIYGQKSPVTAYTSRGPLVGYHLDLGNDTTKDWYGQADIFLGVPFATPPTGNLRYKQPRPLLQFPGPSPYNATHYRSVCIQPSSAYPFSEQSEDCLYLAIWSPNVKSTTKYPVMVEIHGGGLITGSSRMWDNGIVRNFVSQGIVFVSIDYRMGWLGFFTTFTDDFPPNLGMLDQVMALRFIKEEIGYFGGDSNKITILGQSAGGHSVSAHTYSPLSQNLFQGYIAQSGTVLTCYEDSVGPTYHNLAMAEHACNFTQDMWNFGNFAPLKNCLYNIDAFAAQNITNSLGIHNDWVCWNMVQDNYFLPGNPQTLGPKRPNINAIVGTCRDEYFAWQINTVLRDTNLTYYTRKNIESNLLYQYASWFGNSTTNAQQVLKIWEDNYLPPGTADDDHLTWLEFIIAVGTPAYFGWGALRDVEYYIKNKNPNVFTYNFVWSSPLNNHGNPLTNYAPAPHGCEDPYLFGWGSSGNWTPDSQKLATLIQNNWVNFAKTGKPSMDNSWQPSTSTDFSAIEYFEYNITGSQTKTGYRAVDEKVWNQLIPPVLGDYPPNLVDSYPVCSNGYTSKVKNFTCYEAFGTQASWKDAQNNCVQNSYGSLVSITSAFENSDLLSYAKSTFPSCTGFYIGLFRGNSNIQDWTWVNYDPTSYRNWRSGSPSQNPYCTVLNANDGTWTTQDCTQTQCYICGHGV